MKASRACITVVATCCFTFGALQSSLPTTEPTNQPELVKMTVTAKAAPDAALQYQLLPLLPDRTPGNAVLMYYLAKQTMPHVQDLKQFQEKAELI